MNRQLYFDMLKSFNEGFKAALNSDGRVSVTVKTELPLDNPPPLNCKFRKIHPNVRLPERNGAAYDLFLPEEVLISAGQTVRIPLGFACALPEGYSAFILMRSSTWQKWGVCLGTRSVFGTADFAGMTTSSV